MDHLGQLRKNLEDYIRRFYQGRLLQGAVLSLLVLATAWLAVALLAYVGNFSETTRAVLFFSYLALAIVLIGFRVVWPLAQMGGLLKRKNPHEAAREIGRAIAPIEDKLANTLNLQEMAGHNALALASLHQKAATLNQFRFASAVNLREAAGLVKFLAAPVAVFIVLSLWNPAIIGEGTKRVVAFNQSFVPPAPFVFEVQNPKMTVAEGADFNLRVKTNGRALPDYVFIESEAGKVRMKKTAAGVFEHTFENVRSDVLFKLSAAGLWSVPLKVAVMPLPKLLRSRVFVDYPAHTGLQDEELLNRSQLKLPEGSRLSWSFDLKNVDEAGMGRVGEAFEALSQTEGQFRYEYALLSDDELQLAMNNHTGLADTAALSLVAIRDAVPVIAAREMTDSSATGVRYFSGKITDDYGFHALKFQTKVMDGGVLLRSFSVSVPINSIVTEQPFNHIFNLDTIAMKPGQYLEYFMEVWDNDEVNGPKSARSVVWKHEIPTLDELAQKGSEQAEKSKSSMTEQRSALEQMNRDLENLRKDLLQKKNADWQDKERLKEVMDKQKQMMEKLEQKALEQQRQNTQNNRYMEYSESLREKQEQVQDLFENLFDEEYKEKYREYQELMDKLNKDQMLDKLEQMKLDNEQLEKQLDRTLELFKQLEFEQKMEETIRKAEELSQKQEELKQKTGEKNADMTALQNEQDKLRQEAEVLKNDLAKLNELNQSLNEPKAMPDVKQDAQNAQQSMENASEEMQKENRKKSQEQQQNAKDALDRLSQQLSESQAQQDEEQQEEDLETMRQLLENLVGLSKNQEAVMQDLKTTAASDPRFVALTKRQKDLIDDTKTVEDSILALSKREPMISRTLNDEISQVKHTMSKALENMANQHPAQEKMHRETTLTNQQLAMTSLNNLAVLFDNLIQNAQRQMNSKMKGDGQCNKPGSGQGGKPKPSAGDMKKMQESLNQQIQKLKEAMEKGPNPNGKKPGEQQGMGTGGMSKELARMAAQQAAIREQLRQLGNAIEQNGGRPGTQLKEIQKLMEETEEDLLYQNITQQTLTRQQQILTKLLESEKAEREREMDNQRQSKTPVIEHEIPPGIWEKYTLEKEKELELYKTLPPSLKPYYRNEVNRYFSGFQE